MGGNFSRSAGSFSRGCCFGFGAAISQKPSGQPAGESARNAAAAGSDAGQIAGCTRGIFFNGALLFVCFALNTGSRCERNGGLAAIFCQRFTRKDDLLLGDAWHGRRRAAGSFRTPIVVSARLSAAIFISTG